MIENIYQELAHHLDDLPGGFPPTESGVEMRILRRLFTPEEAELALHLTLIDEEPRVIARRAKIPVEEAETRLEEMARRGLIFAIYPAIGPPRYMASQFIVGIYEYQVKNLDSELVQDIEEYFETFTVPERWQQGPQLRTIPVGESIPVQLDVMPYEQAEVLVNAQEKFAVAPCVCRKEKSLLGSECDKPLETCLSFGVAADYYLRQGLGREIDREEALEVLQVANDAGLVLQPGNARDALFICCCCGDCCAVLQMAKRHPKPATVLSSPFVAHLDAESCTSCEMCTLRCQMEALEFDNGAPLLHVDRCIGCGLCVSTCPTGSLSLVRKSEDDQPFVPKDIVDTNIRLGRARGKLKTTDLVMMMVRSKVDRLLA